MKHIQLFEGYMSELDIIRQESKSLQDFIQKAKKEFPQIAKSSDSDSFLTGIWKMSDTVDEKSDNWVKTYEEYLEEGGYYKGISKSTADKKKSQMAKQAAMDDDNPNAYKELPGDTKGKKLLKTSKHTKNYQELYGKD